MIEILVLIFLGKRLGEMLRAKGRSAGWFQFLLVLCWFGGEFIGAVAVVVIGTISSGGAAPGGGGLDAGVYIGALLGAAGGAVIVFVIANALTPIHGMNQNFSAFPVVHDPGRYGGGPPAPPV